MKENVLKRVHQLDFGDLGVVKLSLKLQVDETVPDMKVILPEQQLETALTPIQTAAGSTTENEANIRSLFVSSNVSVDEDIITLYFEQFTEQIGIMKHGENSWILNLRNHSDSLKILEVKEYDFGLSVEVYKEESVADKWDPRRFIITGFKDYCNIKLISLFISNCSQKAQHTWELLDEEKILVTFKEDIDINSFLSKCSSKKLQGMDIKVSRLELISSVLVQGNLSQIKEDVLTDHFSNEMKSGGGDITSLQWINKSNSVAITFKDYQTVNRVVEQKHHLCDTKLTVLLFYSNLQKALMGETPTVSGIQTKISIPVEVEILDFIEHNEQCKSDLQTQLNMVHANGLFHKTPFSGQLVVEMDVDSESLAALHIGPMWEKNARTAAEAFLIKYSVVELSVEVNVWENVENTCLQLITPEADIIFKQTNSKIVIVGLQEVVTDLFGYIKTVVEGAATDFTDRNTTNIEIEKSLEEIIPLSSVQEMQFIESFMNFAEIPEIRNHGISVACACDTPNTPYLTVKAPKNIIQDAFEVVKRHLSSIVVEKLVYSKPGESKVLEKNKANIEAKAKECNCHLYIEQLNKGSATKSFTHTLNDCITLTITEGDLHQLSVDAMICPVATSLTFDNPTAQQLLKVGGSKIQEVFIRLQEDRQTLHAGDVVFTNPGNLSVSMLIYAVLPQRYQSLDSQYLKTAIMDSLLKAEQSICTSIAMPILGCGMFGFSIQECCTALREAVLQFSHDHPNNTNNIKNIIVVDSDLKLMEEFNTLIGQLSIAEPVSGQATQDIRVEKVSIEIKKGDITSERVQAVVNTTNRKMDTQTGVSGALFRAAGPSVEMECQQLAPLQGDKVALTSAGNLQCDFIIHMMGPHSAAETSLRVKKVLEQCEQNKISTVSFPAVGTGRGGLTGTEAMCAILQGFEEHFSQRSLTAVKQICIVTDQDKVLQELQQSFKDWATKESGDEDEDLCEEDSRTYSEHAGQLIWDSDAGFHADNLDPELKNLFDMCGISEAQLKDKKTSKIIYDFIQKKGGLEVVKDQLKKERTLQVVNNTTHIDKQKKKSKRKRLPKTAIGLPHNFRHIGHVGFDVDFSDPELKSLFDMCDISEEQLRDKETRKIIADFIKERGGVDAVKEQFRKEVTMTVQPNDATPSPAEQPLCFDCAVSFPVTTIEVYGTSSADIAKVQKFLDDLISEECTSKDIPCLSNLQEVDKEAIVTLSKNNQVHIAMTSSDRLTVSGRKDDVVDTVLNICIIIQAAKEREFQEYEEKRLRKTLCWEVAEGDAWVKLDSSLSFQLELAFHGKDQNFMYEEEGENYTVNFNELTRKNSRGTSCRIKRTLIGDSDTAIIQTPATWTKMDGRDLEVILLVPDSEEFKKIEKAFLKSSQHHNVPPVQVLQIRRIQNKGQWQRYSVLKQEVDKKYPYQTNEHFLYHGTTKDICQKINKNGFNRSFCGRNATAHGDGTYFAREAYYSCQDKYSSPDENGLKYIYRARVVTGTPCKSRQGMKEPDPLDPKDPRAGLYDCAVDNVRNPFIFVVYCDAGAYPDYLITFRNV